MSDKAMREVVIVGGARTAIGDFMGSLADLTPVQLGVTALKGAITKAGIDKKLIQEVICGQCNQAGSPGNTARHVALGAELPMESFAFTVHQQCASSMRGAELLSQEIMLGKIDIGAVVGVESMSNAPYLLFNARKGYRLNDAERVQDSLMIGGLIVQDLPSRARRVGPDESSTSGERHQERVVQGGNCPRGN
jgi:acetyl-CoA C-acetyltransferase